MRLFGLIALVFALLAAPAHAAPKPKAKAPKYEVGIATRSISPDADGTFAGKPVYLGGYGIGGGSPVLAGRAATGVLGEGPSVRAFVVSDGKNAFAIADIETQGWFAATKNGPYGLIDMRKAVEEATGGALPAESVVVQTDHSHGGADTIGVWGGVPDEYMAFMKDQTVAAIVEAFQTRRRGTLWYGTAPGRDLLSNQFDYDAANEVVDSDVRVLQARDGGEAVRDDAQLLRALDRARLGQHEDHRRLAAAREPDAGAALRRRGDDRHGHARPHAACRPRVPEPAGGRGSRSRSARSTTTRRVWWTEPRRPSRTPSRSRATRWSRRARTWSTDPTSNALLLGMLYGGSAAGIPINRAMTPPWLTGNVIGTITASARIGDVLLSSGPGEMYPQIALKVADTVPARGHMTAGLANDQLGYLIAPYESYPEPIRRSFFNYEGDEVSPIDNDNYFFNVSHTMGERVTCSLLRGAGEVFDKGSEYRDSYDRCAPFVNDTALEHGSDVGLSDLPNPDLTP